MGRLILITGGSGNGKSTFAEDLSLRFAPPYIYIATMKPYGGEEKIERHRRMRADKGFYTLECYTELDFHELPKAGTILLECMCNLTANLMFDECGEERKGSLERVLCSIDAVFSRCATLIAVTNEVGSEPLNYDKNTLLYAETLGRLNIALAKKADVIYELVCGIPLTLKGELIWS